MRTLHALEDLEPLFKILYTFACTESPGKNYRQIYGKSKASLWRNLGTGRLPNFFSTILCFVALAYESYFSEQPFYGNYSTL